jgi:hypothetical protein
MPGPCTLPAPLDRRQSLQLLVGGALLAGTGARAQARATPAAGAPTLDFRGVSHVHRWSREQQHEFTPADDADLKQWRDMITLNVHPSVRDGEALAEVANRVLGNYQQHGKILQTRSTPRSASRPAQHLIVAVLGNPQLLEAAFARCLLHDSTGLVVVVSHRIYGQAAGPAMSRWLSEHGAQVEQALMAWDKLPRMAALQTLGKPA